MPPGRMVIGTGVYGSLPVMTEVIEEAKRRGVELVTVPTADAIKAIQEQTRVTNAILHVTC